LGESPSEDLGLVPIGETGKVLLIARWGDAKHCFGGAFFGSIEWGLA
jgi:hypothetical protein